ncbi:phosphate signaling complex protein PhoU [Natribaculum luteum]|uniref:Phosphate-specific transport system accessory protein PhoU n=1 Tax=Natribaculum luteum TaxID=1586232 RepID=A0ABD5NYM7_9EURY|nr:phosphate signaling complex protein PhoU [Natribaculum luteum]
MSRPAYQKRLKRLRDAVVAMGDLVVTQLETALSTLFSDDSSHARAVVDRDDEVNRRYLELERECLELIALYQPVASDLRFVVAAFKIVTDLERVGDLAANLAAYALRSRSDEMADLDLERLGALALELLEDAVEAFVTDDADAPFVLARRDDELDERCHAVHERIVCRLLERVDDCDSASDDAVADVSRPLLVVRDIERIGDHAVNVAARTLYALEGDETLLE